ATQAKVEHSRALITVKKNATPLADSVSDSEWNAGPVTSLVISPLWWRNYEDPDLKIRALHDGKTIAVQLTWHDATRNVTALRPQDFGDMAAIGLFKGSPEPFLGMGLPDKAVDIWHWRAGWPEAVAQAGAVLDSYAVNYYTAREAGNPIANADQQPSAGNLSAKGFGTTTFRPKTSQLVTSTAT